MRESMRRKRAVLGGHRLSPLILCLLLAAGAAGCSPQAGPAPSEGQMAEIGKPTVYAGLDVVEIDPSSDEEQILRRYQEMRREGEQEGYVPLILYRDDHVLDEILSMSGETQSSREADAREVIRLSSDENGEAFLRERRALYEEWNAYDFSWVEEFVENPPDPDLDTSSMTEGGAPQTQLYVPLTTEQIFIAKLPVPAERPYEALAYVPFGGYNDCPLPQEHVSMARRWYEAYGAVPCAVGYDTLQFYLDRPLTEKADVETSADEMYLYCMDIVDQGVYTLENLKRSVEGSPFWFFWWD